MLAYREVRNLFMDERTHIGRKALDTDGSLEIAKDPGGIVKAIFHTHAWPRLQ